MTELNRQGLEIVNLDVIDVRFPTSLFLDGSDAIHTDPDYSCAYVTVETAKGDKGYGLTFTLGRGTEIVVFAIETLKKLVLGKNAVDIFNNFGELWRTLTSESQIRWIGPEKGVMHLAVAAIVNALWDLWGRLEQKPVWKLLSDLEPEQLVSTIDFRYISDVISKEEAIKLLRDAKKGKEERTATLLRDGYPTYTTQAGWLGYSDEKVANLCTRFINLGFNHFKVKVGQNFEDDYRRCLAVRKMIGPDRSLMVDANQAWDVDEAIDWMKRLSEFNIKFIEEPTSPDDVLGHLAISKALRPLGIAVATGEMCANRVLFKQFLQSGALQYCQIDSARIGGVNEILSVYLMAKKLNVKVWPHAGGVGLCEMVQHLQMWDFLSVSGTMEDRLIEYVDQQHEHFEDPCQVTNANFIVPQAPGYSTKFLQITIDKYLYPSGSEWQRMFKEGLFPYPDEA